MRQAIGPVRRQVDFEDGVVAVKIDCVDGDPRHRQLRSQIARRQIEVDEFFQPVVVDFHNSLFLWKTLPPTPSALCPFRNDGACAVITKWTKWSCNHSSTRRYFEIYDYVNDQSLSVRLLLGLEKHGQVGKDQLIGDEFLDEIAGVSRVVNIARLERPSLLQPQDVFFGKPFDNEIPHPVLRAFGDLQVQRDSSVDVVEDRLPKYL